MNRTIEGAINNIVGKPLSAGFQKVHTNGQRTFGGNGAAKRLPAKPAVPLSKGVKNDPPPRAETAGPKRRTKATEPSINPKHKGRLHRALGVPEGKKIPAAKLERARHSKNAHMREMANYAENAKHFAHPSHEVHVHVHMPEPGAGGY